LGENHCSSVGRSIGTVLRHSLVCKENSAVDDQAGHTDKKHHRESRDNKGLPRRPFHVAFVLSLMVALGS
jgi:hypothetical protein